MKKIKNWIVRKFLVRVFAEVSTSTCANKEAGTITIFDACRHYGFRLGLIAVASLAFPSCLSTDTGNLTKDRTNAVANVLLTKAAKVLGQVAVTSLASAASQEMTGGKVDWQHDAAAAAWAQAPSIVTSDDLEAVLAAATLNHTPVTVAAAGQQLQAAQSAGVPTKDAVNAIANTISGTALAANVILSSKSP